MDNFKVGDLVEIIGCWSLEGRAYIGKRGTIAVIVTGTNPLGEKHDGAIINGISIPKTGGFDLIHLRKIPPDSDKKSHIHKDTLKLFDGHKVENPDKVKERV